MTRTRDAEPTTAGAEAPTTGDDGQIINQQSTPPDPPAPSRQLIDFAATIIAAALLIYSDSPDALKGFAAILEALPANAAPAVLGRSAVRMRVLASTMPDPESDPAWVCPNCNCALHEQVTDDGVQPAVHQKLCSGCGMRYPVSVLPQLMKERTP